MKITRVQRRNFPFYVKPREFWKDDLWEDFTYASVEKFSNKDKTFIDIGSWIGPISLVASKWNKKCIAFEPDPVAREEMTENLKLNAINNVIIDSRAISDSIGVISIGSEGGLGTSNTRITSSENAVNVSCTTFSSIIDEYKLDVNDISIVKIDVEGSEWKVLSDPFFVKHLPPIHLSIHPPFLPNFDKDIGEIYTFLIRYKNVFTDNPVIKDGLHNLPNYKEFYSVCAFN